MNVATTLWGKKWRYTILVSLKPGPKRFSEIRVVLKGCSVKVLSEVLDEMENNHLIIRKQYNTIPVKVTYELDGFVIELLKVSDIYDHALMIFFYKNRFRLNLPPEIISSLQQKVVTTE